MLSPYFIENNRIRPKTIPLIYKAFLNNWIYDYIVLGQDEKI